MKILLVVADSVLGGVTTAAYNFVGELCKRGNDVTFLDLSADKRNQVIDSRAKQIFLEGRSKHWRLGKTELAEAHGAKKAFLAGMGVLKKLTNKSGLWNKLIFKKLKDEYDVAIAYRQCAPCYSFVLNKVKAKKKIGFVHGDVDFMGDISSWQPLMIKFDKIAYVSNAVEKGFVSRYPELATNACTVYNTLDLESIKERAERSDGIIFDKDKFNIVTVSRISNTEKRIDWIPHICKSLADEGLSDFHWYIVGDGDDLDKDVKATKALGMEKDVTFLGQANNPFPILKQANLFVLPTRSESYGLSVVEALILSVPVVVCKYPALSEIFEDGTLGLVAEHSIESVTEKIKLLIKNKQEYCFMRRRCEEYHFSNDTAYDQFLKNIQ